MGSREMGSGNYNKVLADLPLFEIEVIRSHAMASQTGQPRGPSPRGGASAITMGIRKKERAK